MIATHMQRLSHPPLAAGPSLLATARIRQHVSPSGCRWARPRRSSVVISAQRQTETEQKPEVPPVGKAASQQQPEKETEYGVFQWSAFMQPWEVPWGFKELAIGMVGWSVSFGLVALVSLSAGFILGPRGFGLLPAIPPAFTICGIQVAETLVGLWVIRVVVSSFEPLPPDVLKIDVRAPFRKPDGWAFWALLGIAWSGAAVGATSAVFNSLGPAINYDGVGGEGTADAMIGMIALDAPTFAALFVTAGVLAPILEERVFRGFLLPTLTKWMPVPAAVLLSSLAFGAAHFNVRDFPELTALGVLMALCYIRSRNLLTPMVIHGVSNSFSLIVIYLLTSAGLDVRELIHGGAAAAGGGGF